MGESTRHRVSSAKLKILLQPPGWCLDGRIRQGQGLQDAQTLKGMWGGDVPMQRRGWDTPWGTPVFLSFVPALLHSSGYSEGCSSSSSSTVGTKTGSSTLRSLWRGSDGQWAGSREPWGATGEEAPQFGDMVAPTHTPGTASLQDAASCLVPLHSFVTTFSCVTAAGREQALK